MDVLAFGLEVVFCGINPPADAAIGRHNFANGSNRFWKVLHLSGFTDDPILPCDERRLLDHGCGITAVVTRPTARAAEVTPAEFRAARPSFEAEMRSFVPRTIAFLGKPAIGAMTSRSHLPWGRQPDPFAGAVTWVLPNPSGLNRGFTLEALVHAYSAFRLAIDFRHSGSGS
jgi:TDG/mug DNA glycosylase family protein